MARNIRFWRRHGTGEAGDRSGDGRIAAARTSVAATIASWVGTIPFYFWLLGVGIIVAAYFYDALEWWAFIPFTAANAWAAAYWRGLRHGWNEALRMFEQVHLEGFAHVAEQVLASDELSEEDRECLQANYRQATGRLVELATLDAGKRRG